jgi:hypothetical protein
MRNKKTENNKILMVMKNILLVYRENLTINQKTLFLNFE